jgi:hypothetical protein
MVVRTRLIVTLYVNFLPFVKYNKKRKCPQHSKSYVFNLATMKDVTLSVDVIFISSNTPLGLFNATVNILALRSRVPVSALRLVIANNVSH